MKALPFALFDFARKITSGTQLGFQRNRLALQLTCVWSGVLFFPVSTVAIAEQTKKKSITTDDETEVQKHTWNYRLSP